MAREAKILGRVLDVHGREWEVRERRPAPHGWMLLTGWPAGEPRGKGGRGVATIPTQELIEYLHATRLRDVDLPIGLTAIKRLRAEHGINWDWDAWWVERSDDLRSMTLESFCQRHGCSMGAASQRRAALKTK